MATVRVYSTIVLAALTLFLLVFQNCTQPVKNGDSGRFEVQSNGTGYGGKVYVVRLTTGLCADGSDVKARILTLPDGTAGLLDRDDCQDIPGVQIDLRGRGVFKSLQFNHSLNPYDVLVVGGRIFDLMSDGSRTLRFCQGSQIEGAGVRRSDVLVRRENAQTVAYFESAVVDGDEQLIANTAHYTLVFAPTFQSQGANEVYTGSIGQPNGATMLISLLIRGDATGKVSVGPGVVEQDGLSCFAAESP